MARAGRVKQWRPEPARRVGDTVNRLELAPRRLDTLRKLALRFAH
jgi:hypothetical protein